MRFLNIATAPNEQQMTQSAFNPDKQVDDLSSKVVAGLERISEAFKVLLWDKAKALGLSPIQIQILIFVAYHKSSLCTVSHLAKEFNITKATVSDAVRVLLQKDLIAKDFSPTDNRSFLIVLSKTGKTMVAETEHFAQPIQAQVSTLESAQLSQLFETVSTLIYQLNRAGILTVQRTCFGCKFYEKRSAGHYCNLLDKGLVSDELRIDCVEFEGK